MLNLKRKVKILRSVLKAHIRRSDSIRTLESVTVCDNDNWSINFALDGITFTKCARSIRSHASNIIFRVPLFFFALSTIIYLLGALIYESLEKKKSIQHPYNNNTDCRYRFLCLYRLQYSLRVGLDRERERDEIDLL